MRGPWNSVSGNTRLSRNPLPYLIKYASNFDPQDFEAGCLNMLTGHS